MTMNADLEFGEGELLRGAELTVKSNSKKYLFPTKTADSAQGADQITNYV